MTETPLQLSLAVANQIFHRAQQAHSGECLGVVQIMRQRAVFHPGSESAVDDALPVYLHHSADNTAPCFLLVETGTRGVLELKAWRHENGQTLPVQIIAGS